MRVYVEQHGCAVTQAEASVAKGQLARSGHALVSAPEEADAHVLVTCTVVEATERVMRKRITALAATGKRLVVTGCMAKAQLDVVRALSADAVVLPPRSAHQIPEAVEGALVTLRDGSRTGLPRHLEGAVATLAISDGCVGRCSFCITKLARPGLESHPPDAVAADVADAVRAGAVEVRLTSQDTAAYGREKGMSLLDVVRALRDVPGDFRVRVGMMNPMAAMPVLPEILEAYRDPRVFKFLHLPVQSGSGRVLDAMKRDHTSEEFLSIVRAFRREFPGLTLATDVIAGFPGETEDDMQATVRVLREARPAIVNVTRFSPRPGTRAWNIPGRPHGRTVKRWTRFLHAVRFRMSREFHAALVGSALPVLVTEPGKAGTVMARTDDYALVVLPTMPLGWRGPVRIVDARDTYAIGIPAATNAALRA